MPQNPDISCTTCGSVDWWCFCICAIFRKTLTFPQVLSIRSARSTSGTADLSTPTLWKGNDDEEIILDDERLWPNACILVILIALQRGLVTCIYGKGFLDPRAESAGKPCWVMKRNALLQHLRHQPEKSKSKNTTTDFSSDMISHT